MSSLTRVYSIASLVGIALIALLLGFFHRYIAVDALIAHETEANVALTHAFSNTLWPKYARFVAQAHSLPPAGLPARREIAELDVEVKDKARGLRLVKVKIYDLNGLTVYSTEARQIGEDKSGNRGFQQARDGAVASEMVYRDQFSAFEQVVENRHLISSYIPIRRASDGPVEGVFEVYSDITPLVDEIKRTEWLVLGVVTTLMLLLYTFLLAVVRRADRVIQRHEDEDRQAQRKRIHFLAYHDPLTGLGNRTQFAERLHQALDTARRQGRIVGLMFIDLDRFKTINDNLGHEAGDQVLIEAAARIRASLRHRDTACRMGGDEFTVILESLAGVHEATQVAQRLLGGFTEPIRVGNRELAVSASVGISVFPGTSQDGIRLLKDADAAMQRAKADGHNRYVFYSGELDQRAQASLEYEMDLHQALSRQEFVLHYQPIVNIEHPALAGVEALLRWQHPTRGLILPDEFIPLIDDIGLAVPVGEWVLHTACRQCRAWHDAGHGHLRVSVNVSPRQFQSRALVPGVRRALADSGLAPRFLNIELTENVLLHDTERVFEQLRELKRLGVQITIDDFGVGYSSLGYLTRFPINQLKIDRSFVREIVPNRGHAAVTSAIIALARTLDLDIVAEGVETREQLACLRAQGCFLMQGNLFSEPVPAERFAEIARLDIGRYDRAGPPDAVAQGGSGHP